MNTPTMTSHSRLSPQRADSRFRARIVIADDHEIVREGISRILTRLRPDWEVCGEAATGSEAVELVKTLKPGVAVLDISMPGINGLEAARQIAKLNSGCRILVFTVHDSDWLKTEIRDAGAHGYVQKSQAARDLVNAIESLSTGGTFFSDQPGPDFCLTGNFPPERTQRQR